eukprot:6185756-Heterocapsa_arctica.AAC.1
MPATVATRDDKLYGNGKKLYEASRSLSQILRHDDKYLQPINMGGWYLCTDLNNADTEWTQQFLYNIVAFNGKKRFQLAVRTVDKGGNDNRRL